MYAQVTERFEETKDIFGGIACYAGLARFVAQKFHQFDQIGRAEFQKHHAALDFFGNVPDRGTDDDELPLIAAIFIDVAQAAPDLRKLAQRVVEVFQVEDAGALVRDDEIQGSARSLSAGFGGPAVAD